MPNELHRQLAARILLHIRSNGIAEGEHITESALQDFLGTSRAPIRGALTHLADTGVLRSERNRGYFVNDPTATEHSAPEETGDDRALYFRIADDRLTGVLTQTVSENDLMRRYGATRSVLKRALVRIAHEGWIERREGRGWSFTSLIDSVEAYRESYELRRMIEPAGLVSATFKSNSDLLGRLRRQQEMVRDGGWQSLSQLELFDTNSAFHEGLAQMSNNRFLFGVVAQQNQLRRLVEYRQILNREQVQGQNREHIEILDLLDQHDVDAASALLSKHLDTAKNRKARAGIFDD
ncbi:GntR family transcriptional regulator [Devosia sp. 2618]|uniref:GntR family transcriptional regulator n=1 Tax=Devosia sp. 2618 TaxID=3156454 RepID=UPI00339AFE7B